MGVELVRMNKAYFSCWSDEAAQRLEIPMKTEFKKLSIGNQSKVALLLAQEAEVLVLDEPTAGIVSVYLDLSATRDGSAALQSATAVCRTSNLAGEQQTVRPAERVSVGIPCC